MRPGERTARAIRALMIQRWTRPELIAHLEAPDYRTTFYRLLDDIEIGGWRVHVEDGRKSGKPSTYWIDSASPFRLTLPAPPD